MAEYFFLAIAVIGAVILIYFLIKQLKSSGQENKPIDPVPPEPVPPDPVLPEPVPPVKKPIAPVPPEPVLTKDALYARENGMWVCPFCETLNPYPAGVSPERLPSTKPVPVPADPSRLVGDLVRKAAEEAAPTELPPMFCAACGKQNIL